MELEIFTEEKILSDLEIFAEPGFFYGARNLYEFRKQCKALSTSQPGSALCSSSHCHHYHNYHHRFDNYHHHHHNHHHHNHDQHRHNFNHHHH